MRNIDFYNLVKYQERQSERRNSKRNKRDFNSRNARIAQAVERKLGKFKAGSASLPSGSKIIWQ